jgi:hypothetical protein
MNPYLGTNRIIANDFQSCQKLFFGLLMISLLQFINF